VEKLDRVEIEIVTIEKDRVYANFWAWRHGIGEPLGGRAMFEGDRWEILVPRAPMVRKVDRA
jgi:hypothetical protein